MQCREIEYTKTKEYITEQSIVRVYRPTLTEEEIKARMKAVYKAAEELLKDSIKRKGKNYGN